MAQRQPIRRSHDGDSPDPANGLDMERLVADHLAAVYGYALRLSGSPDEAEEITQQTFLAAQRRWQQIRDPERARGWLLAVTRNAFLKGRRRPAPAAATDNGLEIDQVEDPVAPAEHYDLERLQMALDRLDEPFRVVLVMYYYEQASYQEIAEALKIPPGTVMSRLARAKSHLRRSLLRSDSPAGLVDSSVRRSP